MARSLIQKKSDRCFDFLERNGWEAIGEGKDFVSFAKKGYIGVDFNLEGNMVFIGEEGDFLHRYTDYYTLVGVLLEYRQLPINYKSAPRPE